MNIDEETKRKIIDLRNQHRKKIREIVKVVGKSSRDVTVVLKENETKQAQTTKGKKECEVDKRVQCSHEDPLPNVKAYKLFDEGKSPLEVTAELNLLGTQVQQFYVEYWNLRRMYKLVTIYPEIRNNVGYFLKLCRLGKEKDVTPEQIMKLIQMADSIHKLQDRLQYLQSQVVDIMMRKSAGEKRLETLQNEIEAVQEKLDSADKAFKMKYEALKEVCSQLQMLQNYVERFKDGQDYQELESIVRSEVGNILVDNKKLLQSALISVIVALRNDPDKHLLIDRMELTPFTTSTIINYNSFLTLRRLQPYPQGHEQFVNERVLDMAERVLENLQKGIVDNTISTAAGLGKGSPFLTARPALPYYHPTDISFQYSGSEPT